MMCTPPLYSFPPIKNYWLQTWLLLLLWVSFRKSFILRKIVLKFKSISDWELSLAVMEGNCSKSVFKDKIRKQLSNLSVSQKLSYTDLITVFAVLVKSVLEMPWIWFHFSSFLIFDICQLTTYVLQSWLEIQHNYPKFATSAIWEQATLWRASHGLKYLDDKLFFRQHMPPADSFILTCLHSLLGAANGTLSIIHAWCIGLKAPINMSNMEEMISHIWLTYCI